MRTLTMLAQLGRRIVDDTLQGRLLVAAVALMTLETLKEKTLPRKEETDKDSPTDHLPATKSWVRSHSLQEAFYGMPFPLLESSTRVECEALRIPNRYTRIRRHQTLAKMQDSATKATLTSKYEVQWGEFLGEGAFGQVFLAKDRKTGEAVAVKKMPQNMTDNVSFQREMDALLRLRDEGGHPHICGLRENYEEDEHYYLVLDLVSGGEMFDHLCEKGAYSEADAARLVREVASALSFMHGIGIVHGDMKPENLMLSSENASDAVVKLVDFGCAQVLVENGQSFTRGGSNTPAYSPPEVLDQKRKSSTIDPSFDMWALGVILYVMLTGVHPFDLHGNASEAEIEHQIMTRRKPPLKNSPLTSHLSPDAVAVIEKLLNWDPHLRLSALELLADPWVRGDTARTKKMADSDKRLSAYRAFKTKLEAKVFADMISWSENEDNDEITKRTSLIERSFHLLDPAHKGYVTSADLHKLTKESPSKSGEDDAPLSLSGFSDLLAENMKNRYFPKGHIVYHEGEEGNVMYFINSGSIEVYTLDGFSKVLRKPGDFFGEGALMHPMKIRSASIRCVTPVHAIEISREYFEKYLATEEGAMVNLREKDRTRKRQRAKTILGLQQNMQKKVFKKGDVIFKRGEEGSELYILESGEVDVSVDNHKVLSVQPGEMCGEHSLIMSRPRNVTAQCVTKECTLHALRARDFYALLESHPSLKTTVRDICLRRDFQKALCVRTKKAFPKTERQLRAAFQAVDTRKTGALELDEIESMILELDPTYTAKDIKDILVSLDLNASGTVTWEEFKRIFGMAG